MLSGCELDLFAELGVRPPNPIHGAVTAFRDGGLGDRVWTKRIRRYLLLQTKIEVPEARVEIEIHGRSNALGLSEVLAPYHSFLVQHDHERWVVHARAPGCHGGSVDDALRAIDEYVEERGLDLDPAEISAGAS